MYSAIVTSSALLSVFTRQVVSQGTASDNLQYVDPLIGSSNGGQLHISAFAKHLCLGRSSVGQDSLACEH